ncbi:uncharacterized protein AMSG_02026 [Thecamonas trahens ATCC 50062]|uniref:Uncharacterized protein n=1 Tax=Thecamonas trahens ATCC 50062 TaxID=461836 RepID=A0A0L0DUK2_THETB|nr:hypothetical protein AMSG_02026 [Thecamonas trahens ATCC 50062]KNC56014.1 hypothetical protein AMSG_02026 [Thecamonas trahens ATCC 50062]|eukprot:XP_013761058.1 hypothetical protein AMSG_02026 [Thecamonas trahens ATCC 50062]
MRDVIVAPAGPETADSRTASYRKLAGHLGEYGAHMLALRFLPPHLANAAAVMELLKDYPFLAHRDEPGSLFARRDSVRRPHHNVYFATLASPALARAARRDLHGRVLPLAAEGDEPVRLHVDIVG